MANRRFLTPASTYVANPPLLGEDESHPIAGETTAFYQWLINNTKYCYDHLGSPLLTLTPNADGFSIAGGTVSSRIFLLTAGNFSVTAPVTGATLTLTGDLSTSGPFDTSFTQGASTTQTLPVIDTNIVGATGGVCSVSAAAGGSTVTLAGSLTVSSTGTSTIAFPNAGATLTLTGNFTTTGNFGSTFVQGATKIFTLPIVDSWLVGSTTGKLSVVAPAGGTTLTIAGAFDTQFTQVASTTLTLPPASSFLMGSTGAAAMTTVAAADGFTIAGGAASRTLTVIGGAFNLTAAAVGVGLSLSGDLATTGAFNTSFTQQASLTLVLPKETGTIAIEGAVAPTVVMPGQVGNDYIPLDIENERTYVLGGATAAASTITLPAAAANGTKAYCFIDGVLNGHTITFRDATGPVTLTATFVASKRILAIMVKMGGKWMVNAAVEP